MGEETSIARYLRAGKDRRARVDEAVAAFRRLAPEDYGQFLATIEADLGGVPELGGKSPLLLPASTRSSEPATGTLREAVLGLLADNRMRSTQEIRRELAQRRLVKASSLNTEIFTLRKLDLVRSEGQGRGRRHTLATPAPAARPTSTGKREPAPRATRRKRDDDEDHPEHACAATATSKQIPVTTTSASTLKAVSKPPKHKYVSGDDQPGRGRSAALSAEQLYASAIGDHHLLSSAEELELARCLEAAEIALWERLIAGPLGSEARAHLLALDPPVKTTNGAAARAADLDRMIATRVIEMLDRRLADPAVTQGAAQRLRREGTALRKLEREADRLRERFATCNLRLVPSTIRRHGYHNTVGLSMEDLIQEGNLGLLKAIPRFDHRRGLRFSTFATWWIRHFLVRARQNQATEVRVPVHLHDLASKARRAKDAFRDEHGRDPSQAELARVLKVSTKSLVTLDSTWLKHRESLPSFDSVGEDGELPAQLRSNDEPVDETLATLQKDDQIAAAIAAMPSTLGQILWRRFGLGGSNEETLKQIGKSMDLSRERIRQLEVKALELLRQKLDENGAA